MSAMMLVIIQASVPSMRVKGALCRLAVLPTNVPTGGLTWQQQPR